MKEFKRRTRIRTPHKIENQKNKIYAASDDLVIVPKSSDVAAALSTAAMPTMW